MGIAHPAPRNMLNPASRKTYWGSSAKWNLKTRDFVVACRFSWMTMCSWSSFTSSFPATTRTGEGHFRSVIWQLVVRSVIRELRTVLFHSRKSLFRHCNQCACVDRFDTEVTDVRRGCFPLVLLRETIYNSNIVTSGWRPWTKNVCA